MLRAASCSLPVAGGGSPQPAATELAHSLPTVRSSTSLRRQLLCGIGDKSFLCLAANNSANVSSILPLTFPGAAGAGCAQDLCSLAEGCGTPCHCSWIGWLLGISPGPRLPKTSPLFCASFPIHVIASVRCRLSPSLTLQESAVAPLSICRCRRLLGCALPFPPYLYTSPSLFAPSSSTPCKSPPESAVTWFYFLRAPIAQSHLTCRCYSSTAWGKRGQLLPGVSLAAQASLLLPGGGGSCYRAISPPFLSLQLA